MSGTHTHRARAKAVLTEVGERHLSAFAAALAYGAVFSLIPTLALIILMLGIMDAQDLLLRAVDELRALIPAEITTLIEDRVEDLSEDRAELGVGAVVSALLAVWGASGAMRRLMEALNAMWEITDSRSWVRRTAISIVLALGTVLLGVITLGVVVVGGDIAESVFAIVGLESSAKTWWEILRWPLLLALLAVGIAAVYRIAPDRRGAFWTRGVAIAAAGCLVLSLLFSWYVAALGSFSATWGALASIIVLLIYTQLMALVVLFGALIDSRPISALTAGENGRRAR